MCADPEIFVRGDWGVQAQLTEKSSDNVFRPQLILKRGFNGYCKENYNFSRFQGGPTFSSGAQLLIPIETYIICDFPGGGGGVPDPVPLWLRA